MIEVDLVGLENLVASLMNSKGFLCLCTESECDYSPTNSKLNLKARQGLESINVAEIYYSNLQPPTLVVSEVVPREGSASKDAYRGIRGELKRIAETIETNKPSEQIVYIERFPGI
jgi:hypothetical protein